MNWFSIIVAALYDHFYSMSLKRKRVVPWFQTASSIALEAMMISALIAYIVYGYFTDGRKLLIPVYLYVVVGVAYFFIIKFSLFDNGKFLKFYEQFRQYSNNKRRVLKTIVLVLLMLIPFLLGFKIWYDAK